MEKINILVFGDSIVYGMGDYEMGGWVNRLKLKLEHRNDFYFDVYNLGIPDDTSKDVIKRFSNELTSRFYQGRLILIFAIGANDCAQTTMSVETFKENLRGLIYFASMVTDDIAFVGIPHAVDREIEGRLGRKARISEDKAREFNYAIAEVCEDKKVKYVPIRQGVNIENLFDGVHPDPEGHEYISCAVYNYIDRALSTTIPSKKYKCCLCGSPILTPYGNNPEPLSNMGRCCESCNLSLVIPARLKGVKNDGR